MNTQSQNAHTPGPWADGIHNRSRIGGREFAHVTSGKDIVPVAGVPLGVEGYGFDEGAANARLIAAAPELLAALSAILSNHETAGAGSSIFQCCAAEVEAARAAVAKATGGAA